MTEIEKDLLKYHSLKINLLSVCKWIDNCDEKDICFYQDLAICYSDALKSYSNFLKKEYGINICCDNSCIETLCKKQSD